MLGCHDWNSGKYSRKRQTAVASPAKPGDLQLTLGDVVLPGAVDRLNATPRKCLGYKTPHEAFRDELLSLKYGQP